MFEPFIEDDVPFEDYCKTMDDDGTWAGNMELQAASLVTRSNICIHRVIIINDYYLYLLCENHTHGCGFFYLFAEYVTSLVST